jgi:hypothetical protein
MTKHKHLEKRSLLLLAVFGSLTIFFAVLTVVGLTQNSQGAKDRYDTLIAVDQAGGDVEAALNDLRGYIYSHMNTQIGSELGIRPPIQLKGTYERLVVAEEARIAKANEVIYEAAQAKCEAENPAGSLQNRRVPCVEAYLDANGIEPTPIEDAFYKFDFVPPRWSADLAGISMLLAGIFGLIFAVDLILYFKTRSMVRLSQ